jgi:hypothetical protein
MQSERDVTFAMSRTILAIAVCVSVFLAPARAHAAPPTPWRSTRSVARKAGSDRGSGALGGVVVNGRDHA